MKKFSLWFITNLLRVYFRLTLRLDAPDLKNASLQGTVDRHHQSHRAGGGSCFRNPPATEKGSPTGREKPRRSITFFCGGLGIIPVHRGEADITALKSALRMLEDERIFGVAPEGTRNYTGILRRGLPGSAILALKSGAPIVPLVHWGTVYMKNCKGFGAHRFSHPHGRVVSGKGGGQGYLRRTRQQIADEMMCRIAELMPEYYRGNTATF